MAATSFMRLGVMCLGIVPWACGQEQPPALLPQNNTAPRASLITPTVAPVSQPVDLDGSGSQDQEQNTLRYIFWAAGTRVADSANPLVQVSFSRTGLFSVQLEVVDDQGAVAKAAADISVRSEYPMPPTFCAEDLDCRRSDFCVDGVCYQKTVSP